MNIKGTKLNLGAKSLNLWTAKLEGFTVTILEFL